MSCQCLLATYTPSTLLTTPPSHCLPFSIPQQSEIPRTYVKAPPNKTVRDVPAQYQSGASSTSSSMSNLNSHLRGGGSGAMSHSLSGGVSLGNRAIVNSLSALGASAGGNSSSSTGANSTIGGSSSNNSSKPKSDKLKEILRSLTGNKTSKSSASGISISHSSNNNFNNNGSSSSCNNNNYRSNPYGNGSLVGSSGSRSGLGSLNGGNHLAVSGIHNHNHHYRQSTASVQQRQQTQQSGLSSSVPNTSSGSSLGGSNTPMSLSASPSPDTSTHYM